MSRAARTVLKRRIEAWSSPGIKCTPPKVGRVAGSNAEQSERRRPTPSGAVQVLLPEITR